MIELRSEEFNAKVASGQKLLLYFYRKESPSCQLQQAVLEEVDRLISKPFTIYCINSALETELNRLFDIQEVPELIVIQNKRIYKRTKGLTPYQDVLNLLK